MPIPYREPDMYINTVQPENTADKITRAKVDTENTMFEWDYTNKFYFLHIVDNPSPTEEDIKKAIKYLKDEPYDLRANKYDATCLNG